MYAYIAELIEYYQSMIKIFKGKHIQIQQMDSITRNEDDKQRQYIEYILQGRHVIFLKLIRNIYKYQSLGIFLQSLSSSWKLLTSERKRMFLPCTSCLTIE